MASVNKVILVGYVGRDIELRYTPSGQAVANFSLATTDRWTGSDGNKQERTEWHRMVLWGRQAEVANEFVKKGSQIYIEGSLQTREWTDREGQKRYTTEVRVLRFQMLDRKGNSPATGTAAYTPVDNTGDAQFEGGDIPF